jgi:hypothetical protein
MFLSQSKPKERGTEVAQELRGQLFFHKSEHISVAIQGLYNFQQQQKYKSVNWQPYFGKVQLVVG